MKTFFESPGTPGLHEDIFSKKRLKLHQLAADTLSIEKDELFSQGLDSSLLSSTFFYSIFPITDLAEVSSGAIW